MGGSLINDCLTNNFLEMNLKKKSMIYYLKIKKLLKK